MIERALSRLAAFSVGHPWPVIGLTVVATLAFAVFGGSALATVMRLEGGAAGMIPSSAPR